MTVPFIIELTARGLDRGVVWCGVLGGQHSQSSPCNTPRGAAGCSAAYQVTIDGEKRMTLKNDRRKISRGRFRRKRFFLADHVFLSAGGKRKPQDLLSKRRWSQLMDLPTDVVLRTTDHMGKMIEDMQRQQSAWLDAVSLDSDAWPFLHDAYLDVLEEFDAAPLIAAHGYYRQATAGLRNALEAMTHACRFAVAGDQFGFNTWRSGGKEPPSFGNSVDIIGSRSLGKALDDKLGGNGLFGNKPNGVIRDLYAEVSRYAHGRPGFSNSDIWQSNGPVFIPRAFTQFWLDYCDTSLACFAMLKIAYPDARSHKIWNGIAGNAGPSWHNLAPATVNALSLAKPTIAAGGP
jgi:hypothetical protein